MTQVVNHCPNDMQTNCADKEFILCTATLEVRDKPSKSVNWNTESTGWSHPLIHWILPESTKKLKAGPKPLYHPGCGLMGGRTYIL